MEKLDQNLKERADMYVTLARYITPFVDEAYGIAIMQEIGRDLRCEKLSVGTRANGKSNSANGPATPNQLSYLKSLGVRYDQDITKGKASELIEEAKTVSDLAAKVSTE